MSTLTRRVTRVAALTVAMAAATLALTAPAAAADPVAAPTATDDCAAPVDGVTVCLTYTPEPGTPYVYLTGSITIEPGRTIAGGVVSVDACSPCVPQVTAAGSGTDRIVTDRLLYGRGVNYFQANASWVDDQGHRHLGVTNAP
jgi:hypothetical protein